MSDRAKAMVLASFLGDSLALGVHWIYDQARIRALHPNLDGPVAPAPGGYHANRTLGDATHYGDQTFVLLASLAHCHGFDPADFSAAWRALFDGYDGYLDKATKATLERLALGFPPAEAGSPSTDLAGAARLAPLVYALRADEEALVRAARTQTLLTHRDPAVVDAAECFARAALACLGGADPVEALRKGLARTLSGRESASPLPGWFEAGLAAAGQDTPAAVARLGQSCHVQDAFAAVVQTVARHPRDLAGALVACALAGGDSAARGLLVGLLLGAALGPDSLPAPWLAALTRREAIERLLRTIDSGTAS